VACDAGREFDSGLTRQEWVLLLVLAAVQFTHSMDFMVMMPLGPQCREQLGINPQQFALVVAAYGFSAAVAGLLAAGCIDRFDRKTTLLWLYTGLTAGTLVCALAPDYGWLMLGRCVAGAFGGIGAAVILVIIGDAFPEMRRGRATGVVMTAFSLASIGGLPAGILLGNRVGVGAPFGVLTVFSLVILAVAYRVLPPLRGHLTHQAGPGTPAWAVVTRPAHLRAYLFTLLLVMGSFTLAPHFSDYLVHNVGRAKDDLAFVYLCGGALTFITLPLVGRLADRLGKRVVFRVMAACTMALLLVISNLPVAPLVAVLVVTTLYWVATSGRWVPAMAMITSSVVPQYRGSFMSVNASVQQMACGLASVVAGAVVREGEGGQLTGYALAGLIAAGSTAVSMVIAGRLQVAAAAPAASAAALSLADGPGHSPERNGQVEPPADREKVAQNPVV
jgi:predicted MFS family arabinose efflux permease